MHARFIYPLTALCPLFCLGSVQAQPSLSLRKTDSTSAGLTFLATDGVAGCRSITVRVDSSKTEEWLVNWSEPSPWSDGAHVNLKIEDKCTEDARMAFTVDGRSSTPASIDNGLAGATLDFEVVDAWSRRCVEDTPGHYSCTNGSETLIFSGDWLRVGEVYSATSSDRFPAEDGWDYNLSKSDQAYAQISFSIAAAEFHFELSAPDAGYMSRLVSQDVRFRR